jgi:hypothetical protein
LIQEGNVYMGFKLIGCLTFFFLVLRSNSTLQIEFFGSSKHTLTIAGPGYRSPTNSLYR